MQTVSIPKPLIEALLTYLWTRPLNEAYDLFNQLSALVTEQAGQPASEQHAQPAGGALLHRDQIGRQ